MSFDQLPEWVDAIGFAQDAAQYDTYTNRREGEEGGLTPESDMQSTVTNKSFATIATFLSNVLQQLPPIFVIQMMFEVF